MEVEVESALKVDGLGAWLRIGLTLSSMLGAQVGIGVTEDSDRASLDELCVCGYIHKRRTHIPAAARTIRS